MNAIRRIGCSFIFSIGMCVFAGSALSLDLGGMLDKIDNAVKGTSNRDAELKELQEGPRRRMEESQKSERERAADIQSASQGQSAIEQGSVATINAADASAPDTAGFCERIQATEVYQKYAKLTGDGVRDGYFSDPHFSREKADSLFFGRDRRTGVLVYNPQGEFYSGSRSEALLFDSSDRLLLQWMLTKRTQFFENNQRYYNIGGEEVKAIVTACFDQLLPTDFAYIFLPPENIQQLRKMFDAANKNQPSAKAVREITASGEIIENNVVKSSPQLNAYKEARNENLFRYQSATNFPHWLALLYGGEKILNLSSAEYMKAYMTELDRNKVEAAASKKADLTKKLAQEKEKEKGKGAIAIIFYILGIILGIGGFFVGLYCADFFISKRDNFHESGFDLLKMRLRIGLGFALVPFAIFVLIGLNF